MRRQHQQCDVIPTLFISSRVSYYASFALHLSQFGEVAVERNQFEMVLIAQSPTINFNFTC